MRLPRLTMLGALAAVALAAPRALDAQVAVKAAKLYTMAGPMVEDGVVVIRDGRIVAVGQASAITVPDGYRVLECAVATPGLIDARSVVGLAGQYNIPHDQDQLETSAPIQPALRALDAYNARERLVAWVRSFGVTTLHTGHAPGELISGQTLIVKTREGTVDDALVEPVAMLAATLSSDARKASGSPGTRGKMMALLRAKLVEAQGYRDKKAAAKDGEAPPVQLDLEALVEVLERRVPLLVTAHREQDLSSALRLAREFGIRVVLDGAAEAYLLLDEIREAGVPVILHAPMARSIGDLENASFETAAKLRRAGILFALESGYESYVPKTRVVLFEAAIAAANGLSFDEALAAITADAARILEIDDRVGSIAVGKDGDVALFDGDPFEYTTHCVGTVIQGEVVSDAKR